MEISLNFELIILKMVHVDAGLILYYYIVGPARLYPFCTVFGFYNNMFVPQKNHNIVKLFNHIIFLRYHHKFQTYYSYRTTIMWFSLKIIWLKCNLIMVTNHIMVTYDTTHVSNSAWILVVLAYLDIIAQR